MHVDGARVQNVHVEETNQNDQEHEPCPEFALSVKDNRLTIISKGTTP